MNEEQKGITIRARLLAKKSGDYIQMVFVDLDTNKYITVTQLPNWNLKSVEIGQDGFLTYQVIHAGIDRWYNKVDGQFYDYRYSAIYLQEFVPLTHVISGGKVVETTSLLRIG